MKKSGPDRKYTQEFRLAAVKQVIDRGRSIPQVARSLEMSPGTLGNWVARTRTLATTTRSAGTRPWDTCRRRNSSGAGAPKART